jgi:hypothetical protein
VKIYTPLDLTSNEVSGLVIEKLGSDPVGPVESRLFYRTDTDLLRYKAGASFYNLQRQSDYLDDFAALVPTQGRLIVGNGTDWTTLAIGAAGRYLRAGATDPAWSVLTLADAVNQGTTAQVLHGNAAGAVSFSAVSLTADVSGVLPIANGGTNAASAAEAFTNLAPLNTGDGSMIWWDEDNTEWAVLGPGTHYNVLFAAAGGHPQWGQVNLSSSDAVAGTLGIGFGGTGQGTALDAFNALSPTTTRGDLITRDATNNVRLAVGGANTFLKSDGTDPAWASIALDDLSDVIITAPATGATLVYNGTNWIDGQLDLSDSDSHTGTLGITNGGTGQTSANAAFNALAPTTTRGDIIYRNTTVNARIAIGTSGFYLRSNGIDPGWTGLTATDITNQGTTTTVLHGNAAGAAAFGPIVAADITNSTITFAKINDIATARFLGRTTAGSGVIEELTATQATAMLNNLVGDSGAGGTKGLVPAPAAGDAAALKYLKADGTWAVVVASMALDDLTDVIITSPATGATLIFNGTNWVDGQLNLADSDAVTGALPIANGGTGSTTAAAAFASLAPSAGGEGSMAYYDDGLTEWVELLSTPDRVLITNGSGTPTWTRLELDNTNHVTGTTAIGNGGTGAATATAAFNALSPITTRGDLITKDATNNVRLAIGTAGKYLRSDGTDPSWATLTLADATNQGTTTTLLHGNAAGAVSFGAVVAGDLAANTVTFAKITQIATDRLLGRDTAATGDIEELTVGGGIEFTGSGGIQRSAFSGGDVTAAAASATLTIANDAVTNAKLADVATATFKGRTTAGSGDPEDLTVTQATALLNNVVGDAGAGGTKGLVPAPAAGNAAAGYYLSAAGTFSLPDPGTTIHFQASTATAANARSVGAISTTSVAAAPIVSAGKTAYFMAVIAAIETGTTNGDYTVDVIARDEDTPADVIVATLTATVAGGVAQVMRVHSHATAITSALGSLAAGKRYRIGWLNRTTSPGALSTTAKSVYIRVLEV